MESVLEGSSTCLREQQQQQEIRTIGNISINSDVNKDPDIDSAIHISNSRYLFLNKELRR